MTSVSGVGGARNNRFKEEEMLSSQDTRQTNNQGLLYGSQEKRGRFGSSMKRPDNTFIREGSPIIGSGDLNITT